jgi:hypothetical protein
MTAFCFRSLSFGRNGLSALTLMTVSGALLLGATQETKPPAEPPPTPPPATAPAQAEPPKDLPRAIDLVNASMEALGGKDKFDAIETMAIVGHMASPMGEIKMDMKSSKSGSFILNQSMAGMGETSMGSNGTIGWMHNPMTGYELLPEEQAKQVKRQSNMYRMLFNIMDEFKTIETIDKVDFVGTESYKIRMTPRNEGDPEQMGFFGVEDKIFRGFEIKQDGGPMGEVTVTVQLLDWKTINDIKVFNKMTIDQMGMTMDMVFTEVEFNNVDPAVFALPEEVKTLVAELSSPAVSPTAPSTTPAAPTTAPDAPKSE